MVDRAPKVQACDGCRTRKVRCSGRQPCPQCEHFNLHCTFSPKKERTYGRRGRLVAQLRSSSAGNQKKAGSASSFPALRPRGSDDGREEPSGLETLPVEGSAAPAPPSAQHARPTRDYSPAASHAQGQRQPSLQDAQTPLASHATSYTAGYFLSLIPDFENYAYPVNPIITPAKIRTSIGLMSTDATCAALVYSFAAVTTNLTMTQQRHTHTRLSINFINSSNELGMPFTTSERIHDLMNLSLRAKGLSTPTDALSDSSHSDDLVETRIATCIFLEICWMAFRKPEKAFVVLREAIAWIQLLHVDRGPGMLTGPEHAQRQRIYWEAYIHERFMTITSFFPSILPPLRHRQGMRDPSIPANIDSGFRRIIKLFLVLDDELLATWMAQNDNAADPLSFDRLEKDNITVGWIERKQQQLDDEEAEVEAEQQRLEGTPAALTELQLADLFITRAWMRTIIWQIAMSDFLLSSGSGGSERHEALSLFFPAHRLSVQLRKLTEFRVETSIGKHGSGILQKIFEIANTIADVLSLFPVASAGPLEAGDSDSGGKVGSREFDQNQARQCMSDLLLLVKVLLSFERIDSTQRDIILSKLDTLRAIFPGMDFDG